MKYFLFLLFIPQVMSSIPVPEMNQVMQMIRGPLVQKLSDLADNYIALMDENNIQYKADKDFTCHHYGVKKGEKVFHISWEEDDNSISIIYHGCKSQLLLKEHFQFESKSAAFPIYDYLLGKRGWEKFQGSYRLTNFEGTHLVTYDSKIKDGQQQISLRIFQKDFFRILRFATSERFTFYPYTISYSLDGNTSRIENEINISSYYSEKIDAYNTMYFLSNREPISKFDYVQGISLFLASGTGIVKNYLELLIKRMPVTQILKNVGGSNRFLDELQIMRRRLLTGGTPQDINLVRIKLDEFIDGINKNLIQVNDRRPATDENN